MTTIKVFFNDGDHEIYDSSRSGGSYTNTVRYEGGFVIVTDVWGKETAWPVKDVKKVEVIPTRYY